jgi:hypothetical protein
VGEEPALAHSEVGREAAQREALETLDRGDLHRVAEDRVARLVAADPAPVALLLRGRGNFCGAVCALIEQLCNPHHRKL